MSNSTTAIKDGRFPSAALVAQADGSTAIVEACRLITEGSTTAAAAVIRQQYPFSLRLNLLGVTHTRK